MMEMRWKYETDEYDDGKSNDGYERSDVSPELSENQRKTTAKNISMR